MYCANVYPGPASHQGRFRNIPIVLSVHSSLECDWWVNAYLHKGVIDGWAQGCALRYGWLPWRCVTMVHEVNLPVSTSALPEIPQHHPKNVSSLLFSIVSLVGGRALYWRESWFMVALYEEPKAAWKTHHDCAVLLHILSWKVIMSIKQIYSRCSDQ